MQCVDEIWQEGTTITLIHGDLHSGNVVTASGQPYIIDWDHARYGSFYLDLPNLFPGENVRRYYRSLARSGVVIDERQFAERYCEMGRYVGFKYLAYVLFHWHQRDEPGSWVRGGLENLLDMTLNGAKPYKY
jgi:aminoglycoside phosphotransferase (APT) family kinase protein